MLVKNVLSEDAQQALAAGFAEVQLSDCYVYHWFDLPNGETIVGSWDLRRTWPAYLGDVDFRGMRVLEPGAASGYLSLKMEEMGAEVVCVELPPGCTPDLLPVPGLDSDALAAEQLKIADRVRNSWWFFHRAFGSKNKIAYGNIYNLPVGVGRFDAAFLGAILLHLANPFEAIRQVAGITDRMIVVTDLLHDEFGFRPYMEFSPHPESKDPMCWWYISPFSVARMLMAVGFTPIHYSYHHHPHHPTLAQDHTIRHSFFSVVGRR